MANQPGNVRYRSDISCRVLLSTEANPLHIEQSFGRLLLAA